MIGRDLELVAQLLREGKPVAVPTETVYGLAANALDEEAVTEVFRIKNRPYFDPLIVHVANADNAWQYAVNIREDSVKLAAAFWPGPLTLLLEKADNIPDLVTSGSSKVALRVPRHPLTLQLLQMLEFPLAAPSANPFGYISPTRPEHVQDQLGDQVEYILDGGPCEVGLESTIVDCTSDTPLVLRLGGLTLASLESILGFMPECRVRGGSNPSAPGMLDRHYSPESGVILTDDPEKAIIMNRDKKCAFLLFGDAEVPVLGYTLNLSPAGDLSEAARNLFHYMRVLDAVKPDLIIAMKLPDIGLGAAINDRLQRASF